MSYFDGLASNLFFDATSSSFDKEGTVQVFSGDVVAIGPSILISADLIKMDNAKNLLIASGRLVLISGSNVYTGSKIEFSNSTGDFLLEDGVILFNDKKKSQEIINEILGFSTEELQFETDRQAALEQVKREKSEIKLQASFSQNENFNIPDQDLVERYYNLLLREDLIKNRTNPHTQFQEDVLNRRVKTRRKFWEESRKTKSIFLTEELGEKYYFRLEGKSIKRVNKNDYSVEESSWTPCHCEEDESPAWGFTSKKAFAQEGGYINMSNSVLEIKGFPILYLPYLKMPIKEKRQSGFLLPYFSDDSESGTVFSQPVFFDLADHYDATFKFDFFQNRGVKLGGEFRIEQGTHSGWLVSGQTIRDRKWVVDRGIRDELGSLYYDGLLYVDESPGPEPVIEDLSSKDVIRERLKQRSFWQNVEWTENDWGNKQTPEDVCGITDDNVENLELCQAAFRNLFKAPKNNARNALYWRGQSFLAPRLSVVSKGELLSDHRIPQDLYLDNESQVLNKSDFVSYLFGTDNLAQTYTKTKIQLHLDNSDVYAGVGNSFSDVFNLSGRFEGQQIPYHLKMQTRYYDLFPNYDWLNIYSFAKMEYINIAEFEGEEDFSFNQIQSDDLRTTLGSGYWQSVNMGIVSPLVSDGFATLNYYADLEARSIRFENDDGSNAINSWQNGFKIIMPIDGKAEIVDDDDQEELGLKQKHYLHHLMQFTVDFKWRPSVVKRGTYDAYIEENGEFAFFAKDYLNTSQNVAFELKQQWGTSTSRWNLNSTGANTGSEQGVSRVSREQAFRELSNSGENALILQEYPDNTTSIDVRDRYFLHEGGMSTFAQWELDINYDYLKGKRKEKLERKREILEASGLGDDSEEIIDIDEKIRLNYPWSDLYSTSYILYSAWRLENNFAYNIQDSFMRSLRFALNLPPVVKTSMGLSYNIEKNREDERSNVSQLVRTHRRGVSLGTAYFTDYYASAFFEEIRKESIVDYKTGFKLAYNDPSNCWGIEFERNEDITQSDGRIPEYLVKLRVDFLGRSISKNTTPKNVVRDLPYGERQYDR